MFSDFFDGVATILDYLNPFSENFILSGVFSFLSDIVAYINPFSEKFFVYKLIELLGNLLQSLFVPSDDYFTNHIDNLKSSLSQKIPYEDYIQMFETIQQVESGNDISIDLNGYNFGGNIINFSNFINFSWITKYKDTWYAWVRGIMFILLIIYNINQIMKLFRGYTLGEGNSRDVNTSSGAVYDTGSHTWVKGGDGK